MNPLLPAAWQKDLILASASPRRAEILAMLGFEFEIVTTAVEDEPLDEPDPVAHARAQARRKVAAVARLRPGGTCIGADTIVVVDGAILGKPSSRADFEGIPSTARVDLSKRFRHIDNSAGPIGLVWSFVEDIHFIRVGG